MTIECFTRRAPPGTCVADTVTLSMDSRQRSRLRVRLDRSGSTAALVLPRGTVLRGGDRLLGDAGRIIEVIAAPERLAIVVSPDPLLLARVAYHLGNRHVPVEIGSEWLYYREDHVLDAMMASMGLTVRHGTFPFEPEVGPGHSHSHHSGGDGYEDRLRSHG